MISAKIVTDSIANNVRLTTMELNYPRFIHSEFMTHRMFSRNASSSRAIPIEKMLEQVQQSPAMPIHWGKNQPGMQAREECINKVNWGYSDYWGEVKECWQVASQDMIHYAERLSEAGYHKQVVNRLLEPFQYIKVIVTATEWDNFFKLRLHEDAQPEMCALAKAMKDAMDNSSPVAMLPGQWHLPYYYGSCTNEKGDPELDVAIKCSVARCARVSYLNHDNSSPDVEKDIALADRLLKDGHMSPFEHVATPMLEYSGVSKDKSHRLGIYEWDVGTTHMDWNYNLWSGNFRGWLQYRQML